MRKVALVTGGTRGIGLGIASCLAQEGHDLVLCGRREESAVQNVLYAIKNNGVQVLYVQADISDGDSREHLVNTVRKKYGQLNVLVNNAGIAPRERKDILQATETSFDELIAVNLKGPYFLTQSIANWMIEQRQADDKYQGCIINITSISAIVASVNRGDYCLTKAALAMSTKLWAVRLGEYSIPVYEIRPGIIKTDMTSGVTAKYDKLIDEGLLLQARWGTPEDVGKVATMLIRGDMPYSTGQVLMVDGGFSVERL